MSATRQRKPSEAALFSRAECMALKALWAGNASESQQLLAVKWIIESAARAHEMDWYPGGHEGDRDSCFASGRRFVGQQIIGAIKFDVSILKEKENG